MTKFLKIISFFNLQISFIKQTSYWSFLKHSRFFPCQLFDLRHTNLGVCSLYGGANSNTLELTPKKDVLFIIGDWNAKAGSQETPGLTAKFGSGIKNEAAQTLTEFCQENTLVITNTLFQQHKEDSTHGHHQMVKTEIRLIIFFAAQDGEALCSQQKQDRELTVAQIMSSLLPNSDLN